MKKLLCISPHFAPVNAADMHRLRQCLPYLREYGWDPVVFTVKPSLVEIDHDPLLLKTIPDNIEIHYVGAVPARIARLVLLGNIGFRSWFTLRRAVSRYLQKNHVDLIFFTTTVFTSIAHGPYWKRRFGVPFAIDLQDPWRNDYYLKLPISERPKKFWFDYAQKKYFEARTMPHVDGIVSVSQDYIKTVCERYPSVNNIDSVTLPFAASPADFKIARKLPAIIKKDGLISVVYVGRGGHDMSYAIEALFGALTELRKFKPVLAARLRFQFIGTSYASVGRGVQTIAPIAERFGVADLVVEKPDRLPYFKALRALLDADVVFIPGSDDSAYTASKIFPYILAQRPLLAVLHKCSSATSILRETRAGTVVEFSSESPPARIIKETRISLLNILQSLPFIPDTDWEKFERFSAREMTRRCCGLFDQITKC